jgi:hypothetical protein
MSENESRDYVDHVASVNHVGQQIGPDPVEPGPSPLVGASRPCSPVGPDKEFYEATENTAGFTRHHLVDDKWFRCSGVRAREYQSACPICIADEAIREHTAGLVGKVLTIIDAAGGYNEKQSKAVKDLVKDTLYTEQSSFELEMRRIVTIETKLELRTA